jgi:virginiamycin B lyase
MSTRTSTLDGATRSLLAARGPAVTIPSIRVAGLLLAALFAMAVVLAPRAEAYVYWVGTHGGPGTIESATAIGRANLDGSGVKQDFIVLPRGFATGGLAVDDAHIYWANEASIGRANLDGTGADQRFISDVEMSVGSAVAVDEEHIYWVSRLADDSVDYTRRPGTGAIGRANLDGTGVDENFITGLSFPGRALAVDGAHVYWTGYSHDPVQSFGGPASLSRIGRANLDGTGVDESFITGPVAPLDLAVGDAHLWWTEQPHSRDGTPLDAIRRANLDGTGVEEVIEDGFFVCGGGIAVDGTHVYWTDVHHTPQHEALMRVGRAKLDGSRVNHEFIPDIGDGCGDVAVDGLGPRPSNQFSFGKAKKNKRQGTAELTVKVPGPGELQLAKNKKVKADEEPAEARGKEKLRVKARGKASSKLRRTGKAKVKAEVTYTPDGGEPNTRAKRLRLIKRG